MNDELLEAALYYGSLDAPVFPVHTPRGGEVPCSCGDRDCRSVGRHPRTRNGHLDAFSRAEVQRGAMAMLNEHLETSVDLWTLYNDVLRTPRPPPRSNRGACRLDSVAARDFDACLSESIERVLIELRQVGADCVD